MQVVQNAEHAPPRLFPEVSIAAGRDAYLTSFVAAPQTALRLLGGTLAMISAQWFAFGRPRVTHCLFQSSSSQNANVESEREFPPYFKRSAEMGGGENAPSHLR